MAENQAENKREQDSQQGFFSLFSSMNHGGFFAQLMEFFNSLFSGLSGGFGNIFKSDENGQNLFQRGGAAMGRGVDKGRELVGEGIDALKNLVGHHESSNDYNRVYGSGVKRIPLNDMSVNEVLAWQRNYVKNGSPSSAVGKYQIIQDTLRGLKTEMGLTGNEKMDADLQDRMFMHLAKRRGLDDFLSGKIDQDTMLKNLSKEWASLPKDNSGRSYYHGDGLNRASAAPATVRRALEMVAATTTESTVRFSQAERTGQTLATTPRISSQMNQSSAPQIAAAPKAPQPYIPTISSAVESPAQTPDAPAPQAPRQVALLSPSLAFS